uniref:Uncharacterized protein n=1 Tax=Parascaris equorum TaxID=6256 RepID=A0A914RD77_PAREQ
GDASTFVAKQLASNTANLFGGISDQDWTSDPKNVNRCRLYRTTEYSVPFYMRFDALVEQHHLNRLCVIWVIFQEPGSLILLFSTDEINTSEHLREGKTRRWRNKKKRTSAMIYHDLHHQHQPKLVNLFTPLQVVFKLSLPLADSATGSSCKITL